MRWFPILIALATVLAGCVGSDTPAATPDTPSPGGIEPAVIVDPLLDDESPTSGDAPVWRLGDAWSYTTIADEPQNAVLVVTGVESDAYTLSSTSEDMATFDAMYDISFVGKIRASDLAGHQGTTAVKFFDFPLADGKTWTAAWDDATVALVATKSATGFDIVGTIDGEPFVQYDYTPALRWWSKLEFAGGYGIRVDRFHEGWTGEVLTATAELVYREATGAPVAMPAAGAFTIAEGQTFAVVDLRGAGEMWARAFALQQPDGQPYMGWNSNNFELSDAAASGGGYQISERIPALAGQWHVAAPALHDPSGWAEITVHQVLVVATPFG